MGDGLELVQLIESFPLTDQVIFHSHHVKVVETRFKVYLPDPILRNGQSLENWKDPEANQFIPRFNTVLLEVEELQVLKVFLGDGILSGDFLTMASH